MTDTSAREAFLAGERTDDVAFYLAESVVDDLGPLERFGERVDGGICIVVDGERGRNAFRAATGTDAMAFAREAMTLEGIVEGDLTGGTCPEEAGSEAHGDTDHETRYLLAFAEARNDAVGGIYAEGDVIHAYAKCACGTTYSDRWVVEE